MLISVLLLLLNLPLMFGASLDGESWTEAISAGNSQLDRGLYREAISTFDAALTLADSDAHRGNTLYRLAVAHGKLADYDLAEQCYGDALEIFRREGDSVKAALAMAGLGETYRHEYAPERALALERKNLAALNATGKERSAEAAMVLNITGEILFEQGRFKEADHDMREASGILEETAGPEHPDFAMSLNNLGTVALAQGHNAEAESLFSRALAIRKARFGSEHPAVAATLLSLASVYRVEGRYPQAANACRFSIEMMRRFLPPAHPDLIKAQMQFAMITHDSGDTAESLRILEQTTVLAASTSFSKTMEYRELLNLYAKYLDADGQKGKSRRIRTRAEESSVESRRPSRASSTVTVGELERPR